MALELETREISRILSERTIAEYSTCRLDVLMASDVPPGIKSFFKAEVKRRLEADLAKAPWFAEIRQSEAGSARVAQTLILSLMDAFPFSRKEFLDTLDLAVHFLANFLCRPQWTLENFLFDRAPRISFDALSRGLSYAADYRYLGELTIRSLQRRGQEEISREDFQALIRRIDDEVVRRHNARELAFLAQPMFSFFQIVGDRPRGAIPVEALLVFFEDKRLTLLKEYIQGVSHLRNQTHLTFADLVQLIEDAFAGKALKGPEAPAPPSDPVPAPSVESPAFEPEAASSPPPARDRGVAPADFHRANIALSLTFAGLQERSPRPSLPEMTTLIGPDQRDRFISQIFHGDPAQYTDTLGILDSIKTWSEAEAFLKGLCQVKNLDTNADEVAEFSDTVRRRYTTAERMP